jgi:hypothetical protein
MRIRIIRPMIFHRAFRSMENTPVLQYFYSWSMEKKNWSILQNTPTFMLNFRQSSLNNKIYFQGYHKLHPKIHFLGCLFVECHEVEQKLCN